MGIYKTNHKPKQSLQIYLRGISSHFMLADPWWVGTQSLPQSIVSRLIAFLILVILHKQACDAALNEKSLPPSYRGRLCDSDWIRTNGPHLRRMTLYPAELPNQLLLILGGANLMKN